MVWGTVLKYDAQLLDQIISANNLSYSELQIQIWKKIFSVSVADNLFAFTDNEINMTAKQNNIFLLGLIN